MKVAILGSGFSGMFSALACIDRKVDFDIYTSQMTKPRSVGFQYLHDGCYLKLKPHLLYEFLAGTEIGYAKKIYGENISSSANDLLGSKIIFNLNEASDLLWPEISKKICIRNFGGIGEVREVASKYDLVISSIPVYTLIDSYDYSFVAINCYHKDVDIGMNFVVYDGDPKDKIFRMGCLFNKLFVESSEDLNSLKDTFSCTIQNKIVPNSDVKIKNINNLVFVGRYGTWRKSYLVHNCYYDTLKYLDERRI